MTIDFRVQRMRMVEHQIRTMDVTSHSVLNAFATVPRERFVPERQQQFAYIDEDIEIAPVAEGRPARYVMEPAQLARLVQLAEIRADDAVLEIGCGSGYGAAILANIAGSVVALESDEDLASDASRTLASLGYDNAAVVVGPLAEGYAAGGPYDAILFSGAIEVLPEEILSQLRDGGRLVVVEGRGNAARAKLYRREGEMTSRRAVFNSAIKLLPGFERAKEFVF